MMKAITKTLIVVMAINKDRVPNTQMLVYVQN